MKKYNILTTAIIGVLFFFLSCTDMPKDKQARDSMILAPLEQAGEYIDLHPGFVRAFEFLQQENIDTLSPGRYDLAGDTLFAIVSRDSGKTRQQARLEAHRKYIDIQYVIAGVEEMGWRPTAECTQIATPYDIEKDIMFFNDVPKTWTIVPPGSFVIFFPKDAHAPMVGTGEIHKIVCKVLEAQ